MTPPFFFAMPGNEAMARALASALGSDVGAIEMHSFPDGETYLRFLTGVEGRSIALVCTLDRPNAKLLPLLLAAATARELGAAKVGLVAPYLAYMRQDRAFKPGEAVTSRHVARLLSGAFDWLVTADPHLHRYGSLGEIYSIPTQVAHAAPLMSRWIEAHVARPLIIGPDRESEQWVSSVAAQAHAPWTVLEKVRRGDRHVEISIAAPIELAGRTAVLVDDIISSGTTMIEAVRQLRSLGAQDVVCIAVHGVFADEADVLLARAGARVVTSNSIPHATNAIDATDVLAAAVGELAGAAA
jgi:ribose-phosphate pyrophosphokinase